MPKRIKGFLKIIGACSFQIILQHFVEFQMLLVTEIFRTLEKAIPRVLSTGS
jgi:hypothetical protein